MLWLQMLQRLLHLSSLAGEHGAEAGAVIEKDEARSRKTDDHIGLLVAVHINEAQGGWHKIIIGTVELWPTENARVGRISPWYLDNFDMPVQVKCDKMAWKAVLLVMPHPGIHLEGSRATIAQIITEDSQPAKDGAEHGPENEHGYHAQAQVDERMRLAQGPFPDRPGE